jgi:DNA-binding MarR family transcriptional regulator
MVKASPYALWLHTLAEERKQAIDNELAGCEEVLSIISVMESRGKTVKMTDLVQSLLLGTGPTVQRKVLCLAQHALIEITPSKEDARAKLITMTKAGAALLNERSKQMRKFLT